MLEWLCGPPVPVGPGLFLVFDAMGCAANWLAVLESVVFVALIPVVAGGANADT